MAVDTLTPNFRVCWEDDCKTIKVYDTTGAHSPANTGGWGAANITASAATRAMFYYTKPGETTATELDKTTIVNLQTPVGGEFVLATITLDNAKDGDWTFEYKVFDGAEVVIKKYTVTSLCVVRCCVDKLWAKAASGLMSEDCNCIDDKTSYTSRALVAEATYRAIVSGTSCDNTNARTALLEKLQRICKLENCNC